MRDYISLQDFIRDNPFEQQDLSYLLYVVVNNMEKIGLEYFDQNILPLELRFSKSNFIKVKSLHTRYLSEEQIAILNSQVLEANKTGEYQKVNQICNLILLCLTKDPFMDPEEQINVVEGDREIIKEFKNLLKSARSPSTFLTFKLLRKRIRDIYTSFTSENLFEPYHVEEAKNIEEVKKKEEDNKIKKSKKKVVPRMELMLCNYCNMVSLEPMLIMNICKCRFHKQCFERVIIETIERNELQSEFELAIACQIPKEHLHNADLKSLVELEKERFTLPKPIKLMIKYYFLNVVDNCHYCNCNREDYHKKVDKATKLPYLLCNKRCSFCGDKHGETCPKFRISLNWSY